MAKKRCECGCGNFIPRNVIDRALEVGVIPRFYDSRCLNRWHQRKRRAEAKAARIESMEVQGERASVL